MVFPKYIVPILGLILYNIKFKCGYRTYIIYDIDPKKAIEFNKLKDEEKDEVLPIPPSQFNL